MRKTCLLMFATTLLLMPIVHGQLLKKLKEKAAHAADKALGTDQNENSTTTQETGGGDNNSPSGSTRVKATNETGEGLKSSELPDVNAKLKEADDAYKVAKYGDSRYALQQAIKGIELEMGKQLLKSLPATVMGLAVDSSKDVVTCSSWGWSNMIITREYYNGNKELEISIGKSDPSRYTSYQAYFSSGMQSSNGELNFKEIKVKGRKAVIEFDKSEGYSVCIDAGQAPLIVFKGVNFANEETIMQAVNSFDIDAIIKMTGEN